MAGPLIRHFGIEVPTKIARMIQSVEADFPVVDFLLAVEDGYEALDLMARARHIGHCLGLFLPSDYPQAVEILVQSLGPRLDSTEYFGYEPFLYLPHGFFVAQYGLDYLNASMTALYQITQRFSAEFAIRPFLVAHTEATLAILQSWLHDESSHVRRLVSEGVRPRLPWASRLVMFQQNPEPVIALLNQLKDDPSLYVRRSVANNLNDISKDHPERVFDLMAAWLPPHASVTRKKLVQHALRSAIKAGNARALAILGYQVQEGIELVSVDVPAYLSIGSDVEINFVLRNTNTVQVELLLDLQLEYLKASGKWQPKVFKLKQCTLKAGDTLMLSKKISFKQMTTRRHYVGVHKVNLLINGQLLPMAQLELVN